MRRYQLHPSPGSRVDAVVVGWDPDEARYAPDLSYADGRSDRRSFDQLRGLIHSTRGIAVLDDVLARALLRDRAKVTPGGERLQLPQRRARLRHRVRLDLITSGVSVRRLPDLVRHDRLHVDAEFFLAASAGR
jgi:hypothetical protein